MDVSIQLMQKIKGADDLSGAVEVMQPVLQLRAIVRIAGKAVHDQHVMSLARPQQRAVGTEFDWLIVMVLRFVDDSDALHDTMTPAYAIDSPGATMRFLGFRGEKIHSQALGKELGDELPLNAVSRAVQRRGESSQSALPRRDGDDPTTDSALARQPNIVKPIAGGLV